MQEYLGTGGQKMPIKKVCGASGTIKLLAKEEIEWLLAEVEKVFGSIEDGK